ncbi:MAG: coproporphyrinogen-III oxidase family protein, partial [Acidobacteriaceae bacterium]
LSLFDAIKTEFALAGDAPEITVECAPNSLSDASLAAMLDCGVNRISFGAQSFVDRETSSVARLHKAQDTVRDVERIRRAGIANISLDLIAGLPHQTLESWDYSLEQVIALAVPHVSVYMLEVDEDSRLGNQLLAGGAKYHAHSVPDEDLIVRMYERAIERLEHAGIAQYEISNFARPGWESQHNLKYWLRQPYFGFGADAHSMLPASAPQGRLGEIRDLRFAAIEDLDNFERASNHYPAPPQRLSQRDALEEAMILGMRLNRGVNLNDFATNYSQDPRHLFAGEIEKLQSAGLLHRASETLTLTPRGRLLSNEAFECFLS